MEFGPCALGTVRSRTGICSIDRANEAVVFRSRRPFAPSVLHEKAGLYFDDFYASPYDPQLLG